MACLMDVADTFQAEDVTCGAILVDFVYSLSSNKGSGGILARAQWQDPCRGTMDAHKCQKQQHTLLHGGAPVSYTLLINQERALNFYSLLQPAQQQQSWSL